MPGDTSTRGRAVNSRARWACCRNWSTIRFQQRRSRPCSSGVTRTSISGPGKARDDRAAAQRALAAVDLAGLEERDIATLSGGERRRLSIATILAQDPAVFLLDEPIHQLDPQHQLEVLRIFRRLADAGRTVVVSLHDIGLAARFADSALLLFGDGRWHCGPCDEALNERSIGELYGIPVRELRWEHGRTFVAA